MQGVYNIGAFTLERDLPRLAGASRKTAPAPFSKETGKVSALQVVKSRKQWAETINAEWGKAESFADRAIRHAIETGRQLIAAKGELPHGDFEKMVAGDLLFGKKKACSLMRIAAHGEIANVSNTKLLPHRWVTLYELSKLSEQDFKDAQARGLISKDTSYKAAGAIAGAYAVPEGTPAKQGKSPSHLPSPKEAREVALKTGRLIAANDGNMYSGKSEEEMSAYAERREAIYTIRRAIKVIADCDLTPNQWVASAEPHWLIEFPLSHVEDALKWLAKLQPLLEKKQSVINAA